MDLYDLCWAHDDSFLLIWDSGYYFKFQAYLPTKQMIFEDESNTLLGIKSLSLAPQDDYIAMVTYDEKVVIYNAVSWRKVIEFDPAELNDDENTVNWLFDFLLEIL